MRKRWKSVGLMMAACAALALGGCGDGKDGRNGSNGADGAGAGGPTASVASMTQEEWNQLQLSTTDSKVTGVTINSPPVVKFTVKTADGKPVVGLGSNYTKKDGDKLGTYNNVAFTIAKLVPGANGSPSKWVNYVVTAVSTTTGEVTDGARPTTENVGTLKDNGDGSYEYTFYRDVTLIKDQVAALTDSGNKKKADLGDLTYNANLTHRVVVQIGGNFTGTNVTLDNPINLVYDFVPATGKPADPQRDIVDTDNCKTCHVKFVGFHVPNRGTATAAKETSLRQDPRFCVVCHTDQRKWGQANAVSVNNVFPAGNTYIADGEVQGDFPVFIHKLHANRNIAPGTQNSPAKSTALSKSGYNYAGLEYSHVTYPQPITNCAKCHSGAPQADNWKNVPSRLACGTCHDGINWATGKGTALGEQGALIGGHVGGSASDDSMCALCHKGPDITVYHEPGDQSGTKAGANKALTTYDSVPAGVYTITYEAKSVGITAAGNPQMTFVIKKDGAVVDFGTYSAGGVLIPGTTVLTGPNVIFLQNMVAQPNDGIANPADYNNSALATVSIQTAWQGTNANFELVKNADGSYTVTVKNVTVPATATMLTGILAGTLTQTTTSYPGGVRITPVPALAKFTGTYNSVTFEERRTSVNDAKCNACHGRLHTKSSHVTSLRNSIELCIYCHRTRTNGSNATLLSSNSSALGHVIHGGGKREVQRAAYGAAYPGVLKDCTQCHTDNGYDYSSAAAQKAQGRMLPIQISTGNSVTALPYAPQGFTLPFNASAAGNNIVSSAITHACAGCHDSSSAIAHMRQNGGTFYGLRSAASASAETCLVCHGPGKQYSIKKVHGK